MSSTVGRSLIDKYHVLDNRRWVLSITQQEPDRDTNDIIREMIESYWVDDGFDPEKHYIFFGTDWFDDGLGDYQIHCVPVALRIPIPGREAIGSRLVEYRDSIWIHVWSRSGSDASTYLQQGNMVRKIQEIIHLHQTDFPEIYGYERVRVTDTRHMPASTANTGIFHSVVTAEIRYSMNWI